MREKNDKPQMPDVMEAIFDAVYDSFYDRISATGFRAYRAAKSDIQNESKRDRCARNSRWTGSSETGCISDPEYRKVPICHLSVVVWN